MPDSPFVFGPDGNAVEVGSHGQHDSVYAGSEPVTDEGESSALFEGGTGLGSADNIAVTLLGEDVELRAEDTTYRSGGIGFTVNAHGGGAESYWDNYVLVDDGGAVTATVDDFSGDLSAYSQHPNNPDQFNIVGGELRGKSSSTSTYPISSTSGLQPYPSPGDTFRCDARVEAGGSSAEAWVGFGVQEEPPGDTGLPAAGYTVMIDVAGEMRLVRANGGVTDLDSQTVPIEKGTTYTIEVAWS